MKALGYADMLTLTAIASECMAACVCMSLLCVLVCLCVSSKLCASRRKGDHLSVLCLFLLVQAFNIYERVKSCGINSYSFVISPYLIVLQGHPVTVQYTF